MVESKVAFITAASGAGIGSAIARQLADDGYDVVITDAHERRCREFAQQLSEQYGRPFLAVPLDIGDADMVERCVAQVLDEKGRIDALVNNAG